MDKFKLTKLIERSREVVKEDFLQQRCHDKVVLDLGCIRHSAEFALKDPRWLHMLIKSVSRKVVGVDYLPAEIEKLSENGFEIVYGDVTKPLNISDKFDVIVAGDLIEHLTNFEGFFENCSRLLTPEGVLILTTPNPFYAGEFHYAAFKKNYLINPEHTCWIDPQALSQLAKRFGYYIVEINFLKNSWDLSNLICETERHEYDIHNGTWQNDSISFKLTRKIVGTIFRPLYWCYRVITGSNSYLVRHSDYIVVMKRLPQADQVRGLKGSENGWGANDNKAH